MIRILILFFVCLNCYLSSQTDTTHVIKIHFLYGSKPKHKFKKTEPKLFGGLHGGHVSIEVDGHDYGFHRYKGFHIIAHKKKCKSYFSDSLILSNRYLKKQQSAVISISITNNQYQQLNKIHKNYCANTPYDYAFLGMRCAAATQDILGQIGIVKSKTKFATILSTFYPKKMRKKIFKIAKTNNYELIINNGANTRKWEND